MKTKKPPDIIGDYFKCTKLSLKHVLKNPEINTEKINKAVLSRYTNCCKSEKTFGLLLSGGFDSCLMTSVLIKELINNGHNFCDCEIYLFTIIRGLNNILRYFLLYFFWYESLLYVIR